MTCTFDTDINISLLVKCGSVLSTLIAILCLIMNSSIELSLRAILISYSISNMAGSGMFVYGMVTYVCEHDEHPLDYIFMMTIVLSLSHLLLLILHYYLTLTTSSKKAAVDFSGLIIVAWITSAAVGSMITVSAEHDTGHMILVVAFIVISSFSVKFYFTLVEKHRKREAVQKMFRCNFLQEDENCDDSQGCSVQWNLNLLAVMLFTYIVCSLPWLTNEILGAFHVPFSHVGNSVAVLVYAFNFYIPSTLCMVISWSNCTLFKGRQKDVISLEESYRLRRYYSTITRPSMGALIGLSKYELENLKVKSTPSTFLMKIL